MAGRAWSRPAAAGLLAAAPDDDDAAEEPEWRDSSVGGELLQLLEEDKKSCAERCEKLVFWLCFAVGYIAAAVWLTDELLPTDHLPSMLEPVKSTQRAAKEWALGAGAILGLLLVAALARRKHCRFWELLFPFLFRKTQEDASTLTMLSHRGRVFLGYLWGFLMLASLLSLPFVVYVMMTFDQRLHHIAVLVTCVFAFLATVLSVREIIKHLMNYSSPRLQRHYIRILWMVPIYAITAALSLRLEQEAIFFNAIREACVPRYRRPPPPPTHTTPAPPVCLLLRIMPTS
jgi:MFS family permease